MSEVRALTVRQPWAQAIADGHKLVENRSQGFPKGYRGPLLIHAGQGWSERGRRDPKLLDIYRQGDPFGHALRHDPAYRQRPPWPFAAGVLAVAEVADIHPAASCCAPWGEDTYPPSNPERRPPGIVTHLVLDRVVKLRLSIPARGALGLWRPDDDLRIEVAHALASLVHWDTPGATSVAERGDIAQLWHLLAEDRELT